MVIIFYSLYVSSAWGTDYYKCDGMEYKLHNIHSEKNKSESIYVELNHDAAANKVEITRDIETLHYDKDLKLKDRSIKKRITVLESTKWDDLFVLRGDIDREVIYSGISNKGSLEFVKPYKHDFISGIFDKENKTLVVKTFLYDSGAARFGKTERLEDRSASFLDKILNKKDSAPIDNKLIYGFFWDMKCY